MLKLAPTPPREYEMEALPESGYFQSHFVCEATFICAPLRPDCTSVFLQAQLYPRMVLLLEGVDLLDDRVDDDREVAPARLQREVVARPAVRGGERHLEQAIAALHERVPQLLELGDLGAPEEEVVLLRVAEARRQDLG